MKTRHSVLSHLTDAERTRMLREMEDVLRSAFTPEEEANSSWVVADWRQRVPAMLADGQVYFAHDGHEMVGFLTYRLVDLNGRVCLNLMAASVRPDYQSQGVGLRLNAKAVFRTLLRHPRLDYYIAAHTVNPVALAGWRRRIHGAQRFFPPAPGVVLSEDFLAAAAAFSEQYSGAPRVDLDTGVVKGRHLPGYSPPEGSGEPDIDRLYANEVDSASGDTVLMLIDCNRRMVVDHVGEMVRAFVRSSFASLRLRGAGR